MRGYSVWVEAADGKGTNENFYVNAETQDEAEAQARDKLARDYPPNAWIISVGEKRFSKPTT